LLVALILSLMLGAYRLGFEKGLRYEELQRSKLASTEFARARVYYVADLVPTPAGENSLGQSANALVTRLKTNVQPASWQENGGDAQAQFFETNMSLVVHHDERGQSAVRDYLARLRSEQNSDGSQSKSQ
jgi:hypothetical protein